MTNKKGGTVSVRVPAEIAEQLEKMAQELDRSVSWVARQALIIYLKARDASQG